MSDPNVVLDHLLPIDAVRLGSLVTSVMYPEGDFYRSEPQPAHDETVSTQILDFNYTAEKVKEAGFHTALTMLLSGNRKTTDQKRISISSATCVTRRLLDSGGFFKKSYQDSRQAKAWLEKAIRRRQSVYLITGIKTVTDARVGSDRARRSELGGDVQVPTAVVAGAAVGVPLPFDGGALDIGAGVSSAKGSTDAISFTAPGEQIFAIQCRRIRLSVFASRNVDNVKLDDGFKWNIYVGQRGTGVDPTPTANAVLSDGVQREDLGKAKYEEVEVDGDVFIYAADAGTDSGDLDNPIALP